MSGQQTSPLTTSPKKCPLTVKPLSLSIMRAFKPIPEQEWALAPTTNMFKAMGFPPHQAAFYYNGKAVLLMGIIISDEGEYISWTMFGKDWKPICYKYVLPYARKYLKLLEFKKISHIISKDIPHTRHMARAFGFKFDHDIDEKYEWWVINGS